MFSTCHWKSTSEDIKQTQTFKVLVMTFLLCLLLKQIFLKCHTNALHNYTPLRGINFFGEK